MTIVSVRISHPHRGKDDIVKGRLLRFAGIAARYGANARVAKVVAGANAGAMHSWNAYENFEAGAKSFSAYVNDPEYLALMQEIGSQPGADNEGPYVARFVHGAPVKKSFVIQREWATDREGMQKAKSMMDALEGIVKPHDVAVTLVAPAIGPDHQVMYANYSFNSMEHWGKVMDIMMTDKKMIDFQDRAAGMGTLRSSSAVQIVG